MGREADQDENQCDCRTAVVRAFGELRKRNMSQKAALESARAVFSFHHPDIPEADARKTINAWLTN
tara:strand:+ start:3880 stop:4077 length:198 start_codon:yes stop_codon:yes gene_type:complete